MGIAVSQVQRHTSLESSYIPVVLRREILRLGHYTCVFCGKKERHDLCHDIPKCLGGKTELSNLVVCCNECRRRKDVKTATEFKEELAWRGRAQNVHCETVKESIPLEIYFLDGEVLKGTTNSLPGKKTENIWMSPEGNGQAVFVNLSGSVKKIVFRGLDTKGLQPLTSTSTSAKIDSRG